LILGFRIFAIIAKSALTHVPLALSQRREGSSEGALIDGIWMVRNAALTGIAEDVPVQFARQPVHGTSRTLGFIIFYVTSINEQGFFGNRPCGDIIFFTKGKSGIMIPSGHLTRKIKSKNSIGEMAFANFAPYITMDNTMHEERRRT
jgi:hypothetical protein